MELNSKKLTDFILNKYLILQWKDSSIDLYEKYQKWKNQTTSITWLMTWVSECFSMSELRIAVLCLLTWSLHNCSLNMRKLKFNLSIHDHRKIIFLGNEKYTVNEKSPSLSSFWGWTQQPYEWLQTLLTILSESLVQVSYPTYYHKFIWKLCRKQRVTTRYLWFYKNSYNILYKIKGNAW